MKKSYPYLNDKEFLREFDKNRLKKQYVQITLLNWDEEPLQEIQGIASAGSISINGNSSVRRTCSLTLNVKDSKDGAITNAQNLISIGRKIFLEIGIENNSGKYLDYPIIWYPQGVFVFTQCSLSSSASQGLTLSAQLKDKMCLLNGECGGTFTTTVQFDKVDTIDENGKWVITKPTMQQIIREAVNHFGKEQLGRIIISDVDEKVKMVERWTGNNPVYKITSQGSNILTTNSSEYTPESGNEEYQYNDDVGFIYTDFTCPQELIVKPGDNICTGVLDKIKNILGNYEYYYDVFGNFIFQEIKNYMNTTQATVDIQNLDNSDYLIDISMGKAVYDFSDATLIASYSNNPQYNKIKNDYVIWGTRTASSGLKHMIRYHLAIDTKPKTGNVYDVYFYTDEEDGLSKAVVPIKYTNESALPDVGAVGCFYLLTNNNNLLTWDADTLDYIVVGNNLTVKIKATDWRSELYLAGAAAAPLGLAVNDYYAELKAEWPKLYNLKASQPSGADYWVGDFWPEVKEYPWDVDYWLDFIDSQEAISQLGVNLIGRRSLSEQKDDYNCVFEREVPDFVLIESDQPDTAQKREECIARSQAYIQVSPNIFKNLATGGFHNSCFERVKECLYDYTSYNNSISLGTIPIFYLEPNIRVTVNSKVNDIYGDYMINSLSIPLAINGTMNISATKCTEKL